MFSKAFLLVSVLLLPPLAGRAASDALQAPDYKNVVSPPPSVTSDTIAFELFELRRLALQREAIRAQMECEKELSCLTFSGYRLRVSDSTTSMPMTDWLLRESLRRFEPVIAREKRRFNRLRPSQAFPELSAATEVPHHSSYPSGHAAVATLIAEILAQLSPHLGPEFRRDAKAIALNREIAGLHYRSDTVAGMALAGLMLSALQTETWFADAVEVARCEWDNCHFR